VARNIEIKANIESISSVLPKALAQATSAPVEIFQDDTFFQCNNGRLKLRMFDHVRGELIFYRRAHQSGPKESFYLVTPTSEPNTLRDVLSSGQGVIGRVIKQRTLIMCGRTRIHLDRVENLGEFLELEVVLEEDESPENAIAEATLLMADLGVSPQQLIEDSYVDMLARKNKR
jgi:predicted adenylyl cyclase CyaB